MERTCVYPLAPDVFPTPTFTAQTGLQLIGDVVFRHKDLFAVLAFDDERISPVTGHVSLLAQRA
jgi:hypothetical protein